MKIKEKFNTLLLLLLVFCCSRIFDILQIIHLAVIKNNTKAILAVRSQRKHEREKRIHLVSVDKRRKAFFIFNYKSQRSAFLIWWFVDFSCAHRQSKWNLHWKWAENAKVQVLLCGHNNEHRANVLRLFTSAIVLMEKRWWLHFRSSIFRDAHAISYFRKPITYL